MNDAFTNFNCRLRDVGGRVTAIIDDNYGIGPPSELFAANTQFAIELATVGLEAQPSKAECYIDEAYRNADWHTLRGDIPEGILKDADGEPILGDDGEPLRGTMACNIPIGMRSFVSGYLDQRLGLITRKNNVIATLLDPG